MFAPFTPHAWACLIFLARGAWLQDGCECRNKYTFIQTTSLLKFYEAYGKLVLHDSIVAQIVIFVNTFLWFFELCLIYIIKLRPRQSGPLSVSLLLEIHCCWLDGYSWMGSPSKTKSPFLSQRSLASSLIFHSMMGSSISVRRYTTFESESRIIRPCPILSSKSSLPK